MEETETQLTTEEAPKAPVSLSDVVVPTNGLSVMVEDMWLPSPTDAWNAFTGRRAVWGVEWHGTVKAIDAKGDVPWTGPRVCRCPTCQTHVEDKYRPN